MGISIYSVIFPSIVDTAVLVGVTLFRRGAGKR